ncbi:MAG: hypothetical protein RL291_2035 [Pseudomonadota bacterium]
MATTETPPPLELRTDMDFAYGVAKAMTPDILRIVANNPSPYTFKGTNSYLVGSETLALIDPGPDDPAHLDAILRAAAGRPITHILLTHRHSDHVAGLAAAKAKTGAVTAGFPLAVARVEGGGTERMQVFVPDMPLHDGDSVTVDGIEFRALHTPGHAPDHLCFALGGRVASQGIVFSGDHVMGWNTSVIAPPEGNMGAYYASLDKLIARVDDQLYLPGHGRRIENPVRMARAYLVHRHMREEAIYNAIANGARTIPAVVDVVYRGLDPRLTRAAGLSVEAHVVHLAQRGRVTFASDPGSSQPHALAPSAV